VWFPDGVSDGVARVPVLPRRVAAEVSVFAMVRSGHAIAAIVLVVCIPGTAVTVLRHDAGANLTVPILALVIMLAALALAVFRLSPLTLAILLVVGSVGDYAYVLGTLAHHSDLLPTAVVLINRPETALVLIGTAGRRPLPAVVWGIGGFVAGVAATGLAEAQLGLPLQLGNGPAITLADYCAVCLALSIVQRYQHNRVPDFLQLRGETRRLEAVRSGEQSAVALLHDTVLNDLALVINGPDELDTRTVERLRTDVRTLDAADILPDQDAGELVAESDGDIRNQMILLVSDFQWRGLSVEVTGDTGTVVRMTKAAVSAAVGTMRACLENVLAHSGTDTAEIIISSTESSVTWTVSDAGVGFDPSAVGDDRLGLRASIFRRVQSAGGIVKVWSSPGNGTSVLFTLPMLPKSTPKALSGSPTPIAEPS
jgi:hypothetical protein